MSDPAPPPTMTYTSCSPRVTVAQVRGCNCNAINGDPDPLVPDETVQGAIDEACDIFDRATDWTYRGECEATIRPCRKVWPCAPGMGFRTLDRLGFGAEVLGQLWPDFLGFVSTGSLFVPMWLCSCNDDPCGCQTDRTIRLPYLPVRSVAEVKIDGAVFTDWVHLPGTNIVQRTDGRPWPSTQILDPTNNGPGSWSVKFTHGWDLPPGVSRRIASVACELAKSCARQPCSMPEGVKVTEVNGIPIVTYDRYREQGLTGWPVLDDWIANARGGVDGARIRPSMSRPFGRRRGGRETAWPPTP